MIIYLCEKGFFSFDGHQNNIHSFQNLMFSNKFYVPITLLLLLSCRSYLVRGIPDEQFCVEICLSSVF